MRLPRHFVETPSAGLAVDAGSRAAHATCTWQGGVHVGLVSLRKRAHGGDLGIDGQIPDLEGAGPIRAREHAGFDGGPLGVVDGVLAGDVEDGGVDVEFALGLALGTGGGGRGAGAGSRCGGGDVRGGGGADAPELDGPVEGGGQDEVGEVDGAGGAVEVEAHDRGGVAGVEDAGVGAGSGAGAGVTVRDVQEAGLGAEEGVGGVGGGEGGGGWGKVVGRAGGERVGGVGGRLGEGWGGEELEVLLRVGQHVDRPGAEDAVGGGGDDVVRVLGADDVDGVDGMGVAGAGEGRALHGVVAARPRVPEEDLARVGAAEDEVGVEGRELGGQDVRGRVEGVFGAGVHVRVPDLEEARGVIRGGGVLGVRGEDQFGELDGD